MPNGFEEAFNKWKKQATDAFGILETIKPISRQERVAKQSPWLETSELSPLQKVISWLMRSQYPRHYTTKGALIPGLPGPEAEEAEKEILKEAPAELEQIAKYEEATWFLNVYSATPDDFASANITSFDDYLKQHPPEPSTDPADLEQARMRVEAILSPTAPTDLTPEDYDSAKEFITSPLETRPRFKGVHLTTVEEMIKWLKKEIPTPELPENLTEGELTKYLKDEKGLTDEELAAIEEQTTDWATMMEEYEASREQIRRYRMGLETPEMPAMPIGDRVKLFFSQPALAAMEAMQPYWTYWNYPETAIAVRYASKIGQIFPRPFVNADVRKEEEAIISELDRLYEQNREAGMGFWMAHSKAWQDWEHSEWSKMGLEVVLDPVTYLGFGLFIKAAKATKGIPFIGRVMGGLGAFERGFITVAEAPFTAVKGWVKTFPKTAGQRATFAGTDTTTKISAIHCKLVKPGKVASQITLDDFVELNKEAINHVLAHPDATDDLAILGWEYVQRTPLTHDDLLTLASRVGSKLQAEDITQGMISNFNHIIEHAKIKGSKYQVYNMEVAAQKILREVFEVTDTEARMKVVQKFIKESYDKAISKAREISQLPIAESIREAGKLTELNILREAKEGVYLSRLHGGFHAAVMNNVIDPLTTKIWTNWIDKQLIMPFARAYLITGSYAPWNWFEEIYRTLSGRGGFIYGKNTPARLEVVATGLMFDKDMLRGAYLAKESYKTILKNKLTRPGAEFGIGEISEAALLKELEEDIGKPALEKIIMLGWLPGQKGKAVHEALYFPIRASQWAGGMQRSGYTMTKFIENLNDVAPDAMKGIHEALPPPSSLDGIVGLPNKTKKAFIKGIEDRGLVGPSTARNYPKDFSVRNIKTAEVNEACMKYPDLSEITDYAREAAFSGRLWDDIGKFGSDMEDTLFNKLIETPENRAKFMRKFVDDAIGNIDKVQDIDTLMHYAQFLENVSTDLPEVISGLFTGLQRKGAKAGSRKARAEIYSEGYKRIAPFLDEGETQAKRLLDFIHENMGVMEARQAQELEKNLAVYMARVEGITNTRLKAMAKSQELLAEGVRPGSTKWYDAMDAIWKHHFEITDPELFGLQKAAAKGLSVTIGERSVQQPILNAAGRKLTPADVAALHYGTGDNLAYAIMNSQTMMRKPYFVKSTIVEAEAMARRAGTTREALGFTDDAISDVYDQVVYGLRSDPLIHDELTAKLGQLDSLMSDLESIRINGSINHDTVNILQSYADEFATNLEKLDIYKPAKLEGRTMGIEHPPDIPARDFWDANLEYNILRMTEEKSVAARMVARKLENAGDMLREMGKEVSDAGYFMEKFNAIKGSLTDFDWTRPLTGSEVSMISDIKSQIKSIPETTGLTKNIKKLMNGILDRDMKVVASKLKTIESSIKKPPTKPPAVRAGEGSADWWKTKQEAMDKAMISYHQDFTDYSNMNALDAGAKSVFPYWTYESQRWFWLPRHFATHPGVLNTWGKYMDNSDYGYIHMPGTSLDVNVLRGTVFKGGISTLMRRDYPEYYDNAFPELLEAFDYAQRWGFFPNIFWSLPVSTLGGREAQRGQLLPAIARTPLDIFVMAHPDSKAAILLQDKLFPDYFRQYMHITQATHMASDDQVRRGITGVSVWEKMQRHDELTPEEEKLWAGARRKVASVAPLMEHGGIYRLRHEDRTEAYEMFGEYIAEITGIPVDMQTKLRRRGQSVGDVVGGLSQLDMMQIEEAMEYKRWISPRVTAPLRPSHEQEVNLILSEFWGLVRQHNDDNMERLKELEAQAFSGEGGWISKEEYVDRVRSIMADNASYIHDLRGDTYDPATGTWSMNPNAKTKFRIVPVTLEERSVFYNERGVNLTMSTFDEMLAMWYELSPKEIIDPETNRLYTDWSIYFATLDAIESIMPPDLKADWETYMNRNRTPGWLMYREATKEYMAPYWNTANVIKGEFSEEEQELIDEYYLIKDINPLRAKEIEGYTTTGGLQLISQYRSRVADARKKLRMVMPMLDAQLLYWGRTSTLLTPEAEEMYNQLVDRGYSLYQ